MHMFDWVRGRGGRQWNECLACQQWIRVHTRDRSTEPQAGLIKTDEHATPTSEKNTIRKRQKKKKETNGRPWHVHAHFVSCFRVLLVRLVHPTPMYTHLHQAHTPHQHPSSLSFAFHRRPSLRKPRDPRAARRRPKVGGVPSFRGRFC